MDVSADDDLEPLLPLLMLQENLCLAAVGIEILNTREWVRPVFQARDEMGEHYLVRDMHDDPLLFHEYFRMDVPTFHELLEKLHPFIAKLDTNWRKAIPSDTRLAITLRYLASGDSQKSISKSFRVGYSTVGLIIAATCEAIWTVLMPEVLKPPLSPQEWKRIAQGFYEKWNFPMCIGAIDEKHVNIQASANAGSEFFNYKGTHSIVLLAVCDADLCFTLLDVGDSGRHSDGGVFANSEFGKKFILGELNVPRDGCLPGSETYVPYCLVGDAAFPLLPNLMRPYPGKRLPLDKSVFNYRLSRARRVIENAFGVLAARWRIFRGPIIAMPEKAAAITKAACCLHNFLQLRSHDTGMSRETGQGHIDPSNNYPQPFLDALRVGSNMYSRRAYAVREEFKSYFMSDSGRVPWQESVVNRM